MYNVYYIFVSRERVILPTLRSKTNQWTKKHVLGNAYAILSKYRNECQFITFEKF